MDSLGTHPAPRPRLPLNKPNNLGYAPPPPPPDMSDPATQARLTKHNEDMLDVPLPPDSPPPRAKNQPIPFSMNGESSSFGSSSNGGPAQFSQGSFGNQLNDPFGANQQTANNVSGIPGLTYQDKGKKAVRHNPTSVPASSPAFAVGNGSGSGTTAATNDFSGVGYMSRPELERTVIGQSKELNDLNQKKVYENNHLSENYARQLKYKEEEIAALKKKGPENDQLVGQYQTQINQLHQDIAALKKKVTENDQLVGQYQIEINQLNQDIAALQKKEKGNEQEDVDMENGGIPIETSLLICRLETDKATLEENLSSLEKQAEQNKSDIARVKFELDKAIKATDMDRPPNTDLTIYIPASASAICDFKTQVSGLQSEASRHQSEASRLQSEVSRLQSEVSPLQSEVKELRGQKVHEQARLEKETAFRLQLSSESHSLLQKEREQKGLYLKRLRQYMAESAGGTTYEQLQKENGDLKGGIAVAKIAKTHLEREVDVVEAKMANLESEKCTAEKDAKLANENLVLEKDKNQKLGADSQNQKRQYNVLRGEMDNKNKQNATLQKINDAQSLTITTQLATIEAECTKSKQLAAELRDAKERLETVDWDAMAAERKKLDARIAKQEAEEFDRAIKYGYRHTQPKPTVPVASPMPSKKLLFVISCFIVFLIGCGIARFSQSFTSTAHSATVSTIPQITGPVIVESVFEVPVVIPAKPEPLQWTSMDSDDHRDDPSVPSPEAVFVREHYFEAMDLRLPYSPPAPAPAPEKFGWGVDAADWVRRPVKHAMMEVQVLARDWVLGPVRHAKMEILAWAWDCLPRWFQAVVSSER